MFVLALSLYNTWNRGVFLLCKITNLLIYSKKVKKQSAKAAKTIKTKRKQVHDFIHSDNCMVSDILEYQGQNETKTCKRCTVCAQKRRNSK